MTSILWLSALCNFVASGIVTRLYIWPQLRKMPRDRALIPLVCIHMFRFVGLSFLVPGVVSPLVPYGFAGEAAYGDLIAAILAIIAVLGLAARASWAIPMVWFFNIWGTFDLLNAIYQGQVHYGIDPGALGAAFYIPAVLVPLLFISHALIFTILLRPAPAVAASS